MNAIVPMSRSDASAQLGEGGRTTEGTANDAGESSIAVLDSDGRPRKQSDVLVDIGQQYELFHDDGGTPYARLTVGEHKEIHAVGSSAFRELLAHEFLNLSGKGCNRNSLGDAITTLSAVAKFQGKAHRVWLRTAKVEDGIELDSGSVAWSAIHIGRKAWSLKRDQGARFYRAGKPLPLPTPATKGDFSRLWKYLNVRKEDRVLVAAYLLVSLRPSGPYPVLFVSGEQGTGKSTFVRLLKRIIDPSAAPLRSPPKEPRDLLVGALNSWLLCIDNLSWLPAPLSDALCRLSTGGAISERTLYSNLDETLVEVQRPVILNGIEELATRPDLAERGIHIELTRIVKRRTEGELWSAFEEDAPAIFAGLLDGLVQALRDVEAVSMDNLPRMADFALWAEAGLPALGFERGSFIAAYRANQSIGLSLGLESSAVGRAVLSLMAGRIEWTGSAVDLLANLAHLTDEHTLRTPLWPKSARGLHAHLNRLGPALRSAGVQVVRSRTEHDRLITLCSRAEQASEPSARDAADSADASDKLSGELHGGVMETFERRHAMPRPVTCGTCRYFERDTENAAGGMGRCTVARDRLPHEPLPYPFAKRTCAEWLPTPREKT